MFGEFAPTLLFQKESELCWNDFMVGPLIHSFYAVLPGLLSASFNTLLLFGERPSFMVFGSSAFLYDFQHGAANASAAVCNDDDGAFYWHLIHIPPLAS